MSVFEVSSLAISVLGTIFIGLSVLLLARQIKMLLLAHADNHEWNRRIATVNAISQIREINTDSLNDAFDYVNRREPVPLQEIKDAFVRQPNLQPALHKLLNLYEGLANGLSLGIYDEATVRANRESTMIKALANFRSYIEYRRDCGSKTAWIGYEKLVRRWINESVDQHQKPPTGRV